MEKKKAVFCIDSFSVKDGTIVLSVSDYSVRSMIKGLVDFCTTKYGGYIMMEMSPPYKPRSTGVGSQNNKIWAMITEIANSTGNDVDDIQDAVKMRAIRRGYPYKVNRLTGAIKPASMTTINSVEAGYLIDELYQLAAEYEIQMPEC